MFHFGGYNQITSLPGKPVSQFIYSLSGIFGEDHCVSIQVSFHKMSDNIVAFVIVIRRQPGFVPGSPVNSGIPAQVITQAFDYRLQSWGAGSVIKMNIGGLTAAPRRDPAVYPYNSAAKGLKGKTPLFNSLSHLWNCLIYTMYT